METKIHIDDLEFACRKVLGFLDEQGIRTLDVTPLNQSRYLVAKCSDKITRLIMFKREFFRNFSVEFREMGAKGMGETCNVYDLQQAIKKGVKELIFIYPRGDMYAISVDDFLSNSFKRTNKEGKEVRSVSIHLLKRLNK